MARRYSGSAAKRLGARLMQYPPISAERVSCTDLPESVGLTATAAVARTKKVGDFELRSAPPGARTPNRRIKSPLLCH
jgi:hypothetical protein